MDEKIAKLCALSDEEVEIAKKYNSSSARVLKPGGENSGKPCFSIDELMDMAGSLGISKHQNKAQLITAIRKKNGILPPEPIVSLNSVVSSSSHPAFFLSQDGSAAATSTPTVKRNGPTQSAEEPKRHKPAKAETTTSSTTNMQRNNHAVEEEIERNNTKHAFDFNKAILDMKVDNLAEDLRSEVVNMQRTALEEMKKLLQQANAKANKP